jgi:FtsP/CotA-like multicopper oxidase with cupredoxin domain
MIHGGMSGAANASQPLGADTVDIDYPMYLINGRSSADPAVIDAAPGEQVRLRLINAAASTPFRIAASGGAMTVVASDGYELHALPAKTLVIGMGERYDVLVRAPRTGSMSLVAQVEGSVPRFRRCFALREVGSQSTMEPPADLTRSGFFGRPPQNPESSLPVRPADQTFDVVEWRNDGLRMGHRCTKRWWGLNTRARGPTNPHEGHEQHHDVASSTPPRHTFQVVNLNHDGPRKDTIAIAPMDSITIEF